MFTPTAIFAKQVAAGLIPTPPLTNMIMWLDAGQGITTSGGYVTNWADQSGTGNDGYGANGGVLYDASAINGQPALDFSSADTRYMTYTNLLVPNFTDGLHCFIVGTQTFNGSYSNNYYPAFISEGVNSRQVLGLVGKKYPESYIAPATDNYAAGGVYNNGANTYTSGTAYTWEWQFSDFSTLEDAGYINVSTLIKMNGTSIGTLSAWSFPATGKSGTQLFIGNFKDTATGGGGSMLDGYIAEIICYSAPLSAGDATIVRNYLRNKYGHY